MANMLQNLEDDWRRVNARLTDPDLSKGDCALLLEARAFLKHARCRRLKAVLLRGRYRG